MIDVRRLGVQETHYLDPFVEEAIWNAKTSEARTPCAALVINGARLATGINGAVKSFENHCYCKKELTSDHSTCRTHAEQRAIYELLFQGVAAELDSAQLLVVRLNLNGSLRTDLPYYCGCCSRLAKSVGVREWVFLAEDGMEAMDAHTYDELSRVLG